MPIRINEILSSNEAESDQIVNDVLTILQTGCESVSGEFYDDEKSMYYLAYDLMDALTGKRALRCVFSLCLTENESKINNIDVVIPNNKIQQLKFTFRDEDESRSIGEVWEVEKDDIHTKVEVVNRNVFPYELEGDRMISLSAMPYGEVRFADNIGEINKNLGFKPTVTEWQEAAGLGRDPITIGLAPDFVGMGMMICRIISHKKANIGIADHNYDGIIVNLETGLGEMPALLSMKYKDQIKDGRYIVMYADLKADFATAKKYYGRTKIMGFFISPRINNYSLDRNYRSFGMPFLDERTHSLVQLLERAYKEGTHYRNYYGTDYINLWFKSKGVFVSGNRIADGNDFQLILDTVREAGELRADGYDMHETGDCEVELMIVQEYKSVLKRSKTRKQLLMKSKENGNNLLFVDVLNADIIPSFLPGDVLKLQLAGIAEEVHYFKDEEEYKKYAQENNQTYLEDGELLSEGWLVNECSNLDESEKRPQFSDLVRVRGKVEYGYINEIEYNSEGDLTSYNHFWIETKIGSLDIVHSYEQVTNKDLKIIDRGSIFVGLVRLQGDAMNDEYENGMVLNEINNLKALRYAIYTNQPDRISSFVREDVVLDHGKLDLTNKDANEYDIEKTGQTVLQEGLITLKSMIGLYNEEVEGCRTYIASIVKSPEKPEFEQGRNCIFFSGEKRNQSDIIILIDCDNEGMISRIYFRDNYEYTLSADVATDFL